MKLLTAIIVAFFATGCASTNRWHQVAGYPDQNGLSRYEDKNVTCYLFQTGSDVHTMQCHFKDQKSQ